MKEKKANWNDVSLFQYMVMWFISGLFWFLFFLFSFSNAQIPINSSIQIPINSSSTLSDTQFIILYQDQYNSLTQRRLQEIQDLIYANQCK